MSGIRPLAKHCQVGHVGIKGGDKIVPVPICPQAGGWATGIVDQDVDRARRRNDGRMPLRRCNICGDSFDGNPSCRPDRLGCGFQGLRATGIEHKINTRLGQFLRAATAQPLGGCANQCALALDAQIHRNSPCYLARP